MSGIRSLIAYQKCLDTKDLSLQDCITICQAEDAICMQVQDCRPESISTMQTMVPVNRLQQNSRQFHNSNKSRNKSKHCYYCVAPNWTRELQSVQSKKLYLWQLQQERPSRLHVQKQTHAYVRGTVHSTV